MGVQENQADLVGSRLHEGLLLVGWGARDKKPDQPQRAPLCRDRAGNDAGDAHQAPGDGGHCRWIDVFKSLGHLVDLCALADERACHRLIHVRRIGQLKHVQVGVVAFDQVDGHLLKWDVGRRSGDCDKLAGWLVVQHQVGAGRASYEPSMLGRQAALRLNAVRDASDAVRAWLHGQPQ